MVAGEVKPAWYSEKVNPLGTVSIPDLARAQIQLTANTHFLVTLQVPAIALGPQPAPDQPSGTSIKILESLVIVEFIADLYPHAKLIPSDPVERAKARTFAVAGDSAIVSATVAALLGDNVEVLFTGFDKVQSLLSDGTTYAIGNDFSIADISVGPWLARIDLLLENEFFGKFDKSSVTSVIEVYNSPKYDKLREYNRRVQARPSVKKTYVKVSNNIPCPA